MEIDKNFFLKLFDLTYMQRWNDKLRPTPFLEMDKQAHKFMITYLFAKLEEKVNPINWIEIIEGSFFEFLQRVTITDIKPTILNQIKKNPDRERELNQWTFKQIEPLIRPLGQDFIKRYQNYFESQEQTISKRIIGAAHTYSSKWEFQIIERFNPEGYDNDYIREWFEKQMENYYDLKGIQEVALFKSYQKFINLCGQLRFQIRWANLFRSPMTSVLGHSLFVAFASYIFTLLQNGSPKRCYNNTFIGLFHDLPEVLTRDIISPVKNSIEGLGDIIRKCEIEQMNEIVYPLLPEDLVSEIQMYTEMEFSDYIILKNEIVLTSSDEINQKYNNDIFNPRDGKLVKAADELSAFIEAYIAIKNGSVHEEFPKACSKLRNKYQQIEKLGNISIGKLFSSFEDPLNR